MPRIQLARRIASSVAGVSMSKVLRGELDENEQRRFRQAIAALADAPIYLDDSSINTPSEILHKCRRMKNDKNKGLSFVVIDYIGLMKMGGKGYDGNRQQEISDISRNLKVLAKELNVPVIALSQLNRSVESRDDKRPLMSDLRESGSIEQDADIVMFVFRENYYIHNEEPKQKQNETAEHFQQRISDWQKLDRETQNLAEVIIGKQRHGPVGTVRLFWNGQYAQFGNLANEDALPERIGD